MVAYNLKDLVTDVTPVLLVDVRCNRMLWALSALVSGGGGLVDRVEQLGSHWTDRRGIFY